MVLVEDVISFIDVQKEITYRIACDVTEVMHFPDGNEYAICPRCNITLEREYQKFCDRCGQKLNWYSYDKATVIKK